MKFQSHSLLVSLLLVSNFPLPQFALAAEASKAEAKEATSEPEKSAKELQAESENTAEKRRAAEQALREAESSMKEAEAKRREAVAQLKAMGSDRKWAKDVSEADQIRANELLQEGNALLKESFFSQAITKYEESLNYWDHPGTHYNIALALLTLDDPVETNRHLEKAIEFGPDPLEQDKYDYAINYQHLLRKQLTDVLITCDEPGAEVRMDGQFLFRGPATMSVTVLRGDHTIAATKEGYESTQISRRWDSDDPITLNLQLFRTEELYTYTRPYPLWVPTTVTVAGLVFAGAGLGVSFLADKRYDKFDEDMNNNMGCGIGCVPEGETGKTLNQAKAFDLMTTIGYAAGGALVATGITLFILDKKQSHRVTPEDKLELSFTPVIAPTSGGMLLEGSF